MIFPFDRVHEGTRHRLKDLEKARIFQSICLEQAMTRKQIAVALGSRPTTVSNVVHELIRDRLVVEGDVKDPGKQGRPEILLHPCLERLVAMSVYVVSRELKGALIGLDGGVIAQARLELPGDAGNDSVVDAIVALVTKLRSKKPAGSLLLGAGLSVIGSIDQTARTWRFTARWRNISDIDVSAVEDQVGIPVLLDRLVNSRLEYLLLTNPDYRRGGTLLFHWGYGIGAAFALNGQVVQSSFGSFAEAGHWKTYHGSPKRCLCGGYGCLETGAALWALAPELAAKHGPIPEDEPEFASFLCSRGLDSDDLLDAARKQVANCLGNLYMTLYPDRILIYGPFTESKSGYRILLEELLEELPPFARRHLHMTRLPVGFEGDTIGSTHRLFRQALRSLLTVNGGQPVTLTDGGPPH